MMITSDEVTYFRAMCYKRLKMYQEAEEEYKSLTKALNIAMGKRLIKYVFSITLLPLQSDKIVNK